MDKKIRASSSQMEAMVYILMTLSDTAIRNQLRDITDLLTDLAVPRKSVARSWRE